MYSIFFSCPEPEHQATATWHRGYYNPSDIRMTSKQRAKSQPLRTNSQRQDRTGQDMLL